MLRMIANKAAQEFFEYLMCLIAIAALMALVVGYALPRALDAEAKMQQERNYEYVKRINGGE